jgi:hypothetical protein
MKCRYVTATNGPSKHLRLQVFRRVQKYTIGAGLQAQVADESLPECGVISLEGFQHAAETISDQYPRSSSDKSRLADPPFAGDGERGSDTMVQGRRGFTGYERHGIDRCIELGAGAFGQIRNHVQRCAARERMPGGDTISGARDLRRHQHGHYAAGCGQLQ